MANNKGIKSLWGYPLIDSKGRHAIDDVRSNLENNFQKKNDDTLTTISKSITGAINEVNAQYKDIANKTENLGEVVRSKRENEIDDTERLQEAFNVKKNIILSGSYNISKPLKLPNNKITISGNSFKGCTITATNEMSSMIYNDGSVCIENVCIKNICFDGNKKAESCIIVNGGQEWKIENNTFKNYTIHGLKFVKNGDILNYEHQVIFNKFKGVIGLLDSNNDASETIPETCIYISSLVTDMVIRSNTLINARILIENNGQNCSFYNNHMFCYPIPQYQSDVFILNKGRAMIYDNYFDTPKVGLEIVNGNQHIVSNHFYWNPYIDKTNKNDYIGILLNCSQNTNNLVISSNSFDADTSITSETNIDSNKVGYSIKIKDGSGFIVDKCSIFNNLETNIKYPFSKEILTVKGNINGNFIGNLFKDARYVNDSMTQNMGAYLYESDGGYFDYINQDNETIKFIEFLKKSLTIYNSNKVAFNVGNNIINLFQNSLEPIDNFRLGKIDGMIDKTYTKQIFIQGEDGNKYEIKIKADGTIYTVLQN